MLETIAIILLVLWVMGLLTSASTGGWVHVLLTIAVVVMQIRVMPDKKL